MRQECLEGFPRHLLQRKPLVSDLRDACAVMHVRIANPRRRRKRYRHSRRMRNLQFYVCHKRPIAPKYFFMTPFPCVNLLTRLYQSVNHSFCYDKTRNQPHFIMYCMAWELRICSQCDLSIVHNRLRQIILKSENAMTFDIDIQTTFSWQNFESVIRIVVNLFQSIVRISSSNRLAPNNGLL